MSIHDEFQSGFSGLNGSGPGKHVASRLERVDHNWMNLAENAIHSLWTIVRGAGHYGVFKLETIDGYTIETFDGDGSTTVFTLNKAIPRETISGYNILSDHSYSGGVFPTVCTGYLSGFSDSTNLSNTVTFETAPPVGSDNVIIKYCNITEWPSSLNSSAYLLEDEIV